MSNFSGWDKKAINDLEIKKNVKVINETKKPKKVHKDYIAPIQTALTVLNIESTREYKFHPTRNFRFDLALPLFKIAIEYEGGVFINGGHSRGKAYSINCDKYNLAADDGWLVYRFTVKHTEFPAWEYVIAKHMKEIIDKRKKGLL